VHRYGGIVENSKGELSIRLVPGLRTDLHGLKERINPIHIVLLDGISFHNNQRTAVSRAETQQLTRANVRTHFGKLWTLFSDSKVMAQPLYVSGLVVPAANAFSPAAKTKCPAACNLVIFGSMKGTVYAFLADQKPTSPNDTLVCARYLGDPRNGENDIDMWATDNPW
jgi:hypothetical protein